MNGTYLSRNTMQEFAFYLVTRFVEPRIVFRSFFHGTRLDAIGPIADSMVWYSCDNARLLAWRKKG